MTRNRRPSDRQLIGDNMNRLTAVPQELNDRTTIWIAKRIEGISLRLRSSHDDAIVTEMLREGKPLITLKHCGCRTKES